MERIFNFRAPPRRAVWGIGGGLLLLGSVLWTNTHDPFKRKWFNLDTPGYGRVKCVAVLPKTVTGLIPVVLFLHAEGKGIAGSGDEIRAIAEMGFAVVDIDYDQTNLLICQEQFRAVCEWVRSQNWVDTNRIVWIGVSLGADRQIQYLMDDPANKPNLLVRLAGTRGCGWDSKRLKLHFDGVPILMVQGERDRITSVQEQKDGASCFRKAGMKVEFAIVPAASHDFGEYRLVVFREVAEYCLAYLNRFVSKQNSYPDFATYKSILAFQRETPPLWVYCVPAFVWGLIGWCHRIAHLRHSSASLISEIAKEGAGGTWLLSLLLLGAISLSLLHTLVPLLKVNGDTLRIARICLVSIEERSGFEVLAKDAGWRGKCLGDLLEHTKLSYYNRKVINWKCDDTIYEQYVVSSRIDPNWDGNMKWRRELWENIYPRIRNETEPNLAAERIITFLRERVTICESERLAETIDDSWHEQITTPAGFKAMSIAALRCAGIPARLNVQGESEYYFDRAWHFIPEPVLKSLCELN